MNLQPQLLTERPEPVPARLVNDVPVAEEMSDSFLAYALSVITSRAIPDVRDGLKPVQRRVLYSMLQMGVRPGTPYRKSARIVGDTMGRYHPHGDAAIYDTLVRLGQDFSRMIPMVDPQGNFGSLDDPPAAARYTECRLSAAAMDMVGELDEDTVDFRSTYDGEDTEPSVLPAALPNLLVNGTAGIAVGMATNMLPHNLAEIAEAIEAVMAKQRPAKSGSSEPSSARGRARSPRPAIEELMEVVPGPDFPGGGIVLADDGLRSAYETGRGSVRVRARTSVEPLTRRRDAIVVTELPHLVGPERVVSKISELVNAGRLPGVSGVTDLSGLEGLRLQVELKPDADSSDALRELFRLTPLEEAFGVNNVVLVNGVPTTVGLRDLCEHYVAHRLEVITRRTRHRLAKAEQLLHILEGLLIALGNIDEVVALIRGSANAEAAKAGLMERFELTDVQAVQILNMALRRLTALERLKLEEEAERLRSDIVEYRRILDSERKRRSIVRSELRRIVKDHGRPRRAQIVDGALVSAVDGSTESAAAAVIAASGSSTGRDAPCVATLSVTGNLGRMPLTGARRQLAKRHDLVASRATTSTSSTVAVVTTFGRAFTLLGSDIVEASNGIRGAKAASVLGLEPNEHAVAVVATPSDPLVIVTERGSVKRLEAAALLDLESGSPIISLDERDRVVSAFTSPDESDAVVASSDGRALRVASSSLRVQGPRGAGVAGMKLLDGATVVGSGCVLGDSILYQATSDPGLKATRCDELPTQGRGSQGVLAVRLGSSQTVTVAVVGARMPLLALMGRDANPRRVDPVPVELRHEPTARHRAPSRLERPVHALAPPRW